MQLSAHEAFVGTVQGIIWAVFFFLIPVIVYTIVELIIGFPVFINIWTIGYFWLAYYLLKLTTKFY